MKTKKDLEKRIEELETLLKQKDDLIYMLNTQYQNNIPDIDLKCQHEWIMNMNEGMTAPSRICRKCGTWESIQQYPPTMSSKLFPPMSVH